MKELSLWVRLPLIYRTTPMGLISDTVRMLDPEDSRSAYKVDIPLYLKHHPSSPRITILCFKPRFPEVGNPYCVDVFNGLERTEVEGADF